jgi:uncharacterized protein YndB with AHSA1/START domain
VARKSFRHSVHIAAEPDQVFEYFTRPEAILQWIGDYAVLDPRPGGEFALDIEGVPVRGRYVELHPPRKVVISWGHAGSDRLPPGASKVEIILTKERDGTTVQIVHSNLSQIATRTAGRQRFALVVASIRRLTRDLRLGELWPRTSPEAVTVPLQYRGPWNTPPVRWPEELSAYGTAPVQLRWPRTSPAVQWPPLPSEYDPDDGAPAVHYRGPWSSPPVRWPEELSAYGTAPVQYRWPWISPAVRSIAQ